MRAGAESVLDGKRPRENRCAMITSTISEQGQTIVPVSVRKAIKAPPGTVLAWRITGEKAEITALEVPRQKSRVYDYEAHLSKLKKAPAVPDHLLNIARARE